MDPWFPVEEKEGNLQNFSSLFMIVEELNHSYISLLKRCRGKNGLSRVNIFIPLQGTFPSFSLVMTLSMVAQTVKNLPAMWETWVGKVPWRRAWQPTPVCLPGESPWTKEPGRLQFMGHKELDTTERLSTHDFKHGWKSKEMAILLIYLLQTLSWDSPVLGSVSYFLNQRSGPNTCNLAQKGDLGPKYSQLQSSWTNTLCAKQTPSNGNLNCR